jgi:DNA repair protein SbcC/Rad50
VSQQKLRLSSLRAEGFRGICETLEIDFSPQTTVLSAPNGSGKTSVLGAIEWTLFGELKYQPKENTTNDELVNIRHRLQTATVTVELESGDGIVSVTRSKRAGKRAANVIVRLADGTEYDGTEAQSVLFRLLGLTFEDFYRAVYLHQESIRGLLTDEPSLRNEALDRLFGLDKLRDMLMALSKSTKPVRDALNELDKEQGRAVAKLTGAVGEVVKQRQRALDEAKKKGLAEADLSFEEVVSLASQVIEKLMAIAEKVNALIKSLLGPEDLDGVDGFARKTTEVIKVIRQTATDAAAATNASREVIGVGEAVADLLRLSEADAGHDKDLASLETSVGDLNALEDRKVAADQSVQQYQEALEKLGVAERIVQDTLVYIQASVDENKCPACGQDIERQELVKRLERRLNGHIQSELEESRKAQSAQQRLIRELHTAIEKRNQLRGDRKRNGVQLAQSRSAARELLAVDVADDQLLGALDARKDELFKQTATIDMERNQREAEIETIQSSMERLKDITRFLKLDADYQKASSQLGTSDENSSIANQQIESLSQLETGIKAIADIVNIEASTRARDALEGAREGIAALYKELCNHPYFDDISISVESQLVSGIERNNYFIRTHSSLDNRQTLASSRLSTAQINCVALSVYLALASQLEHNLGFVILDDPSQNLDTEHKKALVDILTRLAPQIQVLVGTQDSELDELMGSAAGKDADYRRCLAWSPLTGAAVVTEDE